MSIRDEVKIRELEERIAELEECMAIMIDRLDPLPESAFVKDKEPNKRGVLTLKKDKPNG